jgi:hypothetical protein
LASLPSQANTYLLTWLAPPYICLLFFECSIYFGYHRGGGSLIFGYLLSIYMQPGEYEVEFYLSATDAWAGLCSSLADVCLLLLPIQGGGEILKEGNNKQDF